MKKIYITPKTLIYFGITSDFGMTDDTFYVFKTYENIVPGTEPDHTIDLHEVRLEEDESYPLYYAFTYHNNAEIMYICKYTELTCLGNQQFETHINKKGKEMTRVAITVKKDCYWMNEKVSNKSADKNGYVHLSAKKSMKENNNDRNRNKRDSKKD